MLGQNLIDKIKNIKNIIKNKIYKFGFICIQADWCMSLCHEHHSLVVTARSAG